MPRPSLSFRYRRTLLTTAIVLSLTTFWLVGGHGARVGLAQGSPASFKNFEAPQVHPLALTPDGTRLLAVNTPNATLSVFQLVSGSPVLTAEIPVGLEPVSVAARNDREAWVVNWMSDSVSIVDLTTGNVVRTIDVGDEPTDVVFAGASNARAFVCVSGGGLQFVGFGQITGGSGVVKVFDANNPLFPLTVVDNIGKQPRALARNANGSRVFVSVFESGNQTTVVPESVVAANGGLPPPNPPLASGLPVPPNTSLIVKWDGSNWKDETNKSWTAQIPYTLTDNDLVVIDASAPNPSVSARTRGIGTHIGNMAFDPSTQRLFVANLEDINQVRFEPNLKGRFQASRVSTVDAAAVPPTLLGTSDLNTHVDFNNPAGSDSERALSLTLPADVARHSDGTVYVAATSSAKVGFLNSAGSLVGRVTVGQGPTGLALDEVRHRLYVLNRFDETVSIVDTDGKSQVGQVGIGFNPEPASVRDGRRFLYDATSFSSHGTVSCASCHLNAHRDGVAWDLGHPQGAVSPVSTFLPPAITGSDTLHPMKGPMMTQSLRGIIGNEPFHWRGDRAGLEDFNGAFASLLGGRLLSNEEMASFKLFVKSLVYPPNPNHPPRRTPNEFLGGFLFFSTNKLFGAGPTGGTINCSECHLITNFKVGSDNKITPSASIQESQSVKVAPFRGLYQKLGMDKTQSQQIAGFGFSRDGSFDNLFNFQKAPQFNFAQAGNDATADSWRRDIEQMLLRFDTGTAPAVGLMVTVDANNKSSFNVTSRINDILIPEAQAGNCDLIVRGNYGRVPRSFLRLASGLFQPDSLSEAPVSLQTLINAVTSAGAELTFIGVPPGEGALFGTDRDGNNILNDDEPRTSVQISGRVVDIAGNGIAGVSLNLSGKQSATALTDAQGRYFFNFVSTTGTHTVTPQKTGLSFTPADRSFSNPTFNESATFTTSPTGSAADASPFFVTQHYGDFLNRDPDAPGLAFWINQIEGCGSDQDCRRLKRDNVSGAFFLSIEFKETGYLVYRTYKASFGDQLGKPVPITYQQLMTDTQRVGRNVVVTPPPDNAWQTLLEANKQAFFLGWVQRPEFLVVYPAGMSAANFVDTLNNNTGGSLTPSERNALVSQFSNTTAGRAAAVRQVAENSVFSNREFNKAFVLMQYFGYLRRNPNDPPEANLDFAGYNFWLGKLNEHSGNFIQAEMVKSFIVSGEYRQRFGQ